MNAYSNEGHSGWNSPHSRLKQFLNYNRYAHIIAIVLFILAVVLSIAAAGIVIYTFVTNNGSLFTSTVLDSLERSYDIFLAAGAFSLFTILAVGSFWWFKAESKKYFLPPNKFDKSASICSVISIAVLIVLMILDFLLGTGKVRVFTTSKFVLGSDNPKVTESISLIVSLVFAIIALIVVWIFLSYWSYCYTGWKNSSSPENPNYFPQSRKSMPTQGYGYTPFPQPPQYPPQGFQQPWYPPQGFQQPQYPQQGFQQPPIQNIPPIIYPAPNGPTATKNSNGQTSKSKIQDSKQSVGKPPVKTMPTN